VIDVKSCKLLVLLNLSLTSIRWEILVPKKGFTPQPFSKSFHFNEVPLSIEYTNLSHFSILSTWSTCSTGSYGFRLKVATTPSKNVEEYGHHHD